MGFLPDLGREGIIFNLKSGLALRKDVRFQTSTILHQTTSGFFLFKLLSVKPSLSTNPAVKFLEEAYPIIGYLTLRILV